MNVLNFFRADPKRSTAHKAEILRKVYGAKLNPLISIMDNEVYKDILALVSLGIGSRPDVEVYLKELRVLMEAIRELRAAEINKKSQKKEKGKKTE